MLKEMLRDSTKTGIVPTTMGAPYATAERLDVNAKALRIQAAILAERGDATTRNRKTAMWKRITWETKTANIERVDSAPNKTIVTDRQGANSQGSAITWTTLCRSVAQAYR